MSDDAEFEEYVRQKELGLLVTDLLVRYYIQDLTIITAVRGSDRQYEELRKRELIRIDVLISSHVLFKSASECHRASEARFTRQRNLRFIRQT
jgi:hypothetical protein